MSKINSFYAKMKEIKAVEAKKLDAMRRLLAEQEEKVILNTREQLTPIENEMRSFWARHGYQLQLFINENITKKKRSMTIAGFTIGFKKEQKRIEVEDKEKVLEWAVENGIEEIIEIPEAPEPFVPHKELVKYLKKHEDIKEVGGVKFKPQRDHFYVKQDVEINHLLGMEDKPDEQEEEGEQQG